MPEKTTLSVSSPMNDEDVENNPNEKKITNLTKVGHMCMVCGFRATTKNKYRELQDHLVRQHFQDRIKSALPTRRPFMCPDEGCRVEGKDWQALMRHYTGKHGILEGYLKEVIASGQVSRAYRDNMKKPRISALNPVLDGYEGTPNKENNGRQASISFSRGIKSRKRRKLRQPSSSGSTGSNSSISGVSRGSSGSEDFTTIQNNDQEMPMSTIGVMSLPEGNNNVIETGKVSLVNQTTLCNSNFPNDVTQQLLQLQQPLPPVRYRQNPMDNLPEVIEVDETNVAEKPTHLALVLKQKNPDEGFEIGNSENDTGIMSNTGLQYDEMYAFVDLRNFMPVSPNEYVIVPPKPTSSPNLLNTEDTTGDVHSLSDDFDNFVAVPMPANNLSNATQLQSTQNILSHSHHFPHLSFPSQLTAPINPSIVSNHNGPVIYQNALTNINSLGNGCNSVSQDHTIHIGSDITSGPSSDNLTSIITDVANTDTMPSLTTTYYTNQAGELLTSTALTSQSDGMDNEGLLPGQTFIVPCTSSSSTIPETFNLNTTTLQPHFAPMSRQYITRPCNPQHGIIMSSNSRAGPIMISNPNQSHVGMNVEYKPDIRNDSFSREALHPSQLSHLPLVTLPSRNSGCQQIDLGQIVRQTITAPISSISAEAGEHIQTNGSTSSTTTNLATTAQHIIPMNTELGNHQVYSIPISAFPSSCQTMSTATVEAAEAAVAAANTLNGLPSTTSTIVYRQSNSQDLPVSMAMSTLGNETATTVLKPKAQTNLGEQPLTLQLASTNSLSPTFSTTTASTQSEVCNVISGYQNTGCLVSTSSESSTSVSWCKSLSNLNAGKTVVLQSRPIIMQVKEAMPSSANYENKSIYKTMSGNEDTENDSGIENDCLSTINNRVIVEDAKSIPMDDSTMTIVQIENMDVMNSHDVEVASTVTVESSGNQDRRSPKTLLLLADKNISNPGSPTGSGSSISSTAESHDLSTLESTPAIKAGTIKDGGKEIEFTMF